MAHMFFADFKYKAMVLVFKRESLQWTARDVSDFPSPLFLLSSWVVPATFTQAIYCISLCAAFHFSTFLDAEWRVIWSESHYLNREICKHCLHEEWLGGMRGKTLFLFSDIYFTLNSKWGRGKNLPIHLNKMTINWQVSICITLSTPASSVRSQIVGTKISTFLGLVPLCFQY